MNFWDGEAWRNFIMVVFVVGLFFGGLGKVVTTCIRVDREGQVKLVQALGESVEKVVKEWKR